MAHRSDTVTVGLIERPFGVKGEVKVRSLSDVPGRFEGLHHVSVVAKNGQTWETSVTHVRRAGRGFIVGLAGLTTPEDAAQWRGGLIQATRDAGSSLPDGQYLECDLVGLLVQTEQGEQIGMLEEIWNLPGNPVLVVRQREKETLIPAVKEWVVAIDLNVGVMTVRLMDGLGD